MLLPVVFLAVTFMMAVWIIVKMSIEIINQLKMKKLTQKRLIRERELNGLDVPHLMRRPINQLKD